MRETTREALRFSQLADAVQDALIEKQIERLREDASGLDEQVRAECEPLLDAFKRQWLDGNTAIKILPISPVTVLVESEDGGRQTVYKKGEAIDFSGCVDELLDAMDLMSMIEVLKKKTEDEFFSADNAMILLNGMEVAGARWTEDGRMIL